MKKIIITEREIYAIESVISELESLMEGTLDEDYRRETKANINVLKRIIKKFEKP